MDNHAPPTQKGKMMSDAIMRRAIIAYAAIGVLTFGYSASAPRECFITLTGEKQICDVGGLATLGFISGVAWPLYWTWEIASDARAILSHIEGAHP